MNKKVIIISAPSGSGKTTIINRLLQSGLPLAFSISACTRPMREGEVNGKDYYFLSSDAFRKYIQEDAFVEWEEVYEGSFYGTLRSEPERIWSKGLYVLFDVDVVGGMNIKKVFKDQALSVFIMPPSIEELRKRLEKRGTDTREVIDKRIQKATREINFSERFDHIVVNDNLETAINKVAGLIKNFLEIQ
ncbi:MAG: guanylate kinase [Bacteroidales bacterium]|nr:guanylate kinase [Bacteroidales bacterium]